MKKIATFIVLSVLFMLPVFSEAWYLCLGSYKNKNNAENLVQALKNDGIETVIDNYEKGSDLYYRVLMADYYEDRDTARSKISGVEALPVIQKYKISNIWICSGSEKLQKAVEETENQKKASKENSGISNGVPVSGIGLVPPKTSVSAKTAAIDNINSAASLKKITPEMLPSSNARTFYTTQFGVLNLIKNLDDELEIEDYIEDLTDTLDFEDFADDFEEKIEDTENNEAIEALINKISDALDDYEEIIDENGNISFKVDEHFEKISDSDKAFEMELPQIKINISGTVDDSEDPSEGNIKAEAAFEAYVKLLEEMINIKKLKINGEAAFKIKEETSIFNGDGNLSEEFQADYEKEGIKINISSFNNSVTAKCTYNIDEEKGKIQGDISSDINAELKIDSNNTEYLKESPVKYLTAVFSLNGKSGFDTKFEEDDSISGNAEGVYSANLAAGVTFNTSSGNGGKMIADCSLLFDGKLDLEAISEELEALEDLIDSYDYDEEDKLTQKDFDDLNLPVGFTLKVTFYDDNNRETLKYLDINSLYDLYCCLYDIVQLGE